MVEKLWEDVKKGLKDTVTYVTEKNEELTSTGKVKMDIAGLNRKKEKKLNELGKLVYTKMSKEDGLVLDSDEEVKKVIGDIATFDKELMEKEKELKKIGEKKTVEKAENIDD